jgi:hypothetical protein
MVVAADHAGMCGPILLFQDAAVNLLSKQRKASDDDIDASKRAFRTIVPRGVVLEAETNLGIARNIYRAEQWVFRNMEYPVGIFMEDDMIVSKNYFNLLADLYDISLRQPRIGMFSAYGYDGRLSATSQYAQRSKVGRMHHNWAFALTRSAWLQREVYTRGYMDIVEKYDYRDRPLGKIAAWYARMGWPPLATNQDLAKAVAFNTLGLNRITTAVICGRYIGEIGQHYTPETFAELGFANVAMFEDHYPDATVRLEDPTEQQLDELNRLEREGILQKRLKAEAFVTDDEMIWLGRALEAVGGFGAATRRGDGIVRSLGGCHNDGWFLPTMMIGFAAETALRRIRLDCVLGRHLPEGTTITYSLNNRPVAVASHHPGERFSVDIEVPRQFDGIEKLIQGHCSVTLDPCTAGYNADRRALSALLLRIVLTEASGEETVVVPADLLASTKWS